MKALKYIIIIFCLSLCGQMKAEGGRRYIDAPEKPWQLILRGNISQTIVSMKGDGVAAGEEYDVNAKLKTVPSQYIGLWAGYRGYGIGYTVNVGGDKGSYLTFGATGGAFGINVRIHSFENSKPNMDMDSELLTEEDMEEMKNVMLIDPIHVKTIIADGYYMFNGKKFSYAAAYDQSVIQKRSAGSLMAGLMYNYTDINYASDSNGDLIYRGLLVNVMAMPMLTFVNKLKAYNYETNIEEMMLEPEFWDDTIPYDEWDKWYYENVRIKPMGDQTFNSGLSIGFDTRASITYNIGRYFFNVYGQFNNIRYHHNNSNGYLNDWFIYSSIGIRL